MAPSDGLRGAEKSPNLGLDRKPPAEARGVARDLTLTWPDVHFVVQLAGEIGLRVQTEIREQMRQIPLGARGTSALRVQPEHLANRFKDAILPQVLATPVMILIMENAALNTLKPYLDQIAAIKTQIEMEVDAVVANLLGPRPEVADTGYFQPIGRRLFAPSVCSALSRSTVRSSPQCGPHCSRPNSTCHS